jgi:hypothetical protein
MTRVINSPYLVKGNSKKGARYPMFMSKFKIILLATGVSGAADSRSAPVRR